MILDLFAGPGGWDEGLKAIGRTDVIGIELDRDSCETARQAGHERICADVYSLDPTRFNGIEGIIASPPCQGFSSAGKQGGRNDLDDIYDLLNCISERHDHDLRGDYLLSAHDPRSLLLVEPLRYMQATDASWLILEQVPAVLPVWEWYAEIIGVRDGWSVDFGVLDAADYGAPQQRRRAVLVAKRQPFGMAELPSRLTSLPVPASTVLGAGRHGFPRLNDRNDGGKYRARDFRDNTLPSFTLTEKARSWTIEAAGGEQRQLSASEAGQLQTFPADYPWQGSRSAQFLQVANAIPPLFAAHILAALTGTHLGRAVA